MPTETQTGCLIRPLDDRVVVKRVAMVTTFLELPDSVKDRSLYGEVLAVGEGRRDENGDRHAPELTIGQKVFFAPNAGTELKVDGEQFLVLTEQQILATVDRETEQVTPYGDILLVERIVKDKTASGLHLPDQSHDKTECKVLAVGNGCRFKNGPRRHTMPIEVGEHIYLKMWSGWEVPNTTETRLVKEEFVYAKIERTSDV